MNTGKLGASPWKHLGRLNGGKSLGLSLPLENKHSKRKGKTQEASWYQSVLTQVQDLVWASLTQDTATQV